MMRKYRRYKVQISNPDFHKYGSQPLMWVGTNKREAYRVAKRHDRKVEIYKPPKGFSR
jgi:hypothetical protein